MIGNLEYCSEHNIDQWLDAFNKKKGRSLRVLHVGNIANNAYLNAKFLRQVGVEADVLCYDYFHVMACPEWEDIEIKHGYKDDYFPSFSTRDLKSYQRPEWFIQGPFHICAEYMRARRSNNRLLSMILQKCMIYAVRHKIQGKIFRVFLTFLMRRSGRRYVIKRFYNLLNKIIANLGIFNISVTSTCSAENEENIKRLLDRFKQCFPDRADQLTEEDIIPYIEVIDIWKEVFSGYDVIQCYSTDPIYALLADNKPYVAYEHGTLRTFTMGNDPLHRLTSLAYRNADHVFITNGDCLDYALRLGINKYSAMIHPIDVEQHELLFDANELANIKQELNADILLFCPLRHDWEIKGTDIHLRALPKIISQVKGRVKLIVTDWGGDLAKSRELVKSNHCEDNVVWLSPLCRISMIKYMKAADVVLDQIALPHFGATAPQALAAGTPVISSYEPTSTEWIVESPAPIIPAFTADEVVQAVLSALDKNWLKAFTIKSRRWIHEQHGQNRIICEHLRVYKEILDDLKKDKINA